MSGLMNFISPALTVASEGAAANNEGREQGNALLRAIFAQQASEEEKRAMAQKAMADARLADSRRLADPTKVITTPDGPSIVHMNTGAAAPVMQDGKRIQAPVKAAPRIDPLSPEGIAARKQIQPAARPRNIDPLSPEGIAARLQLKPPTASGSKPLAGPIAAKVGQAGEMLKKASDLLPMMERLDVTAGQSSSQDIAAHGIGIAGHAIPGSKGVGAALVNRTPDYSAYQAALTPFVLAAAHALSGARINQDQVEQIRQSIEVKPGDWNNANVRAQKKKNMIDLINSINGSLPADAIAAQEDQMEAPALTAMKGHGYRGAQRATATGNVSLADQHPKPAGSVTVGGGKPTLQERVQQLKAQGASKEQAKATLIQEGLLPPGDEE